MKQILIFAGLFICTMLTMLIVVTIVILGIVYVPYFALGVLFVIAGMVLATALYLLLQENGYF